MPGSAHRRERLLNQDMERPRLKNRSRTTATTRGRVHSPGNHLTGLLAALLLSTCGGGPAGPGPVPPPPPPPGNAPPTIESVTLGTERVEVSEEVTVTATVRDAETPAGDLKYEWTAEGGTFSGEGASVQWRPPADADTPADYVLELTVTETYGAPDANGVRPSHTVKGSSAAVRVHDSPSEIGDLAMGFLRDFARSSVPADVAVREFSDSCDGKSDEREDIEFNRKYFEIISSSLRLVNTSVASSRMTGTARVACGFTSRIKACPPNRSDCVVGATERVSGDCILTTVYEERRWWLCSSSFHGDRLSFMRLFFGDR